MWSPAASGGKLGGLRGIHLFDIMLTKKGGYNGKIK